jgi:ribosomal protein S18 acetylase RimI-like enzyme
VCAVLATETTIVSVSYGSNWTEFMPESNRRFFAGHRIQGPRSDLRQALDDRYRDMFVAEAPGRPSGPIIGVVSLHIYDVSDQPMMLQGRRAYVEDLVVDQAYRGRGVGRQLMEAAHNWAEHHGARQVVLTVWNGNREAQQFYEQVGYRPINQVLVRDVD